ncbi:MAG: hypothetical protein ACI89X_003561 [Planctomycetota bacterium]
MPRGQRFFKLAAIASFGGASCFFAAGVGLPKMRPWLFLGGGVFCLAGGVWMQLAQRAAAQLRDADLTECSTQECEAPLDIPVARRAFYGLQWACFWCGVGFVAGAAWLDALLYGAGIGFCLGWMMRVGILRYLWWKITLRGLQVWRPFVWRRFFILLI